MFPNEVLFTFGYSYEHAPRYSLPPIPSRGRFEGVETPLYKAPKATPAFWDYPVEEPFALPNRKGILTHPAWLVAFSVNTASDPIRRNSGGSFKAVVVSLLTSDSFSYRKRPGN